MSVVEWDPSAQDLKVSSLHSFEGDPSLRAGRAAAPPPRLAADPLGRCAAAVVFGRHAAVLPALEADALEAALLARHDSGGAGSGGAAAAAAATRPAAVLGNSYLIDLAKEAGAGVARDAAFLHGYAEPLLLILHEAPPTWAGRYRAARDTCKLAALSINVRRRRHPVIWSHDGLPSDCRAVVAAPRGGALVLAQNLLLYFAQGARAASGSRPTSCCSASRPAN